MEPVIIYPPTIDWDQLHQRPQQLLKALSRIGANCIFCNLNLHRRHADGFEPLSSSLILANGVSLAQAGRWARNTYPNSPLVIYYTYPPQSEYLSAFHCDLTVFDSVDEPCDEFSGWRSGYASALKNSDIILASAKTLYQSAQQHTSQPVYLLPNGCDYEHFAQSQTPQSVTELPFTSGKPVIGYIGAIAPWLDWTLIYTMAHSLPQFEFVFIGSPLLQPGICLAGQNMHYLGHRDYISLPRYLSRFDFCLIPFRLTEMTKGVNPVKFWEYLASGKPILSTRLPEIPSSAVTFIDETMFPRFVPIASLAGRDERIRLAQANAWAIRAEKLLAVIKSALAKG